MSCSNSSPSPQDFNAALNRLIEVARARGAAIGVASALPGDIERLARWSAALELEGRRVGPAVSSHVADGAERVSRGQAIVSNSLPYRPCVGVALANRNGEAFIGHRRRKRGGEALDARSWQMPQGEIDSGEEPMAAARRELWEETSIRSIELIAELPEWLNYDLPDEARGRWSGRYRGQSQKWFLFRFVGTEREIDVRRPAGGAHDAEFDEWRWERFERLPDLVVPFKRRVYETVAAAFAPLARPPWPSQ